MKNGVEKGLTHMLLAAFLCGATGVGIALPAQASAGEYKFDFGGGTVETGYTGVSASLSYDLARGYGFRTLRICVMSVLRGLEWQVMRYVSWLQVRKARILLMLIFLLVCMRCRLL